MLTSGKLWMDTAHPKFRLVQLMKRLIISFVIILSGFSAGYSQEKLVAFFENDLKKYATAYNERNWEVVTSMLNPGLYELMPKEAFIKQLSGLDEQGVKISIRIGSVKKISEQVVHEEKKYRLVTYSCSITIQLTNDGLDIDALGKSLVDVYGTEKVKIDNEKRSIVTSSDQSMIASSPSDGDKWTYLENTAQGRKLLLHIIPAEVVNKLEGKTGDDTAAADETAPESKPEETPEEPADATVPEQ